MTDTTSSEQRFLHSIGMNTPNLAAQRRDATKFRVPRVEILQLSGQALQCAISGTDVSVVNALRRIIYAEVGHSFRFSVFV